MTHSLAHSTLTRPRRRRAAWAAALAAAFATGLVGGCAGEEVPVGLELELLVTQRDNFQGRMVRTSGVVRGHPEPQHFWLENEALQRVGLTPTERVAAWLDQEVEVVGRFGFAADTGRRITVQQISPRDTPHGDDTAAGDR